MPFERQPHRRATACLKSLSTIPTVFWSGLSPAQIPWLESLTLASTWSVSAFHTRTALSEPVETRNFRSRLKEAERTVPSRRLPDP